MYLANYNKTRFTVQKIGFRFTIWIKSEAWFVKNGNTILYYPIKYNFYISSSQANSL